jgi:hypothetical protein
MSMILDGSNGVTFNDASLQGAAASPYVLKNRIINGAMEIDQRNNGASVNLTTSTVFSVDRWNTYASQTGKATIQQNAGSVTPPAGFTKYTGVTTTSAATLGASDIFQLFQIIEGFNIADLGWGTANAKTVTLSFWVRSSLTGTFGGSLNNSGNARSYPFSYTISAANTWEYKTITVAGDTSGTWLTTNGAGMVVNLNLGAGSAYSGTANTWASANYTTPTGATSVVGTSGATFYITGVQLEQNTSATPFERRLYNQELANCQRYFYSYNAASPFNTDTGGYARQPLFVTTSTQGKWYPQYPVPMRACPTVSFANIVSAATGIYNYSTAAPVSITSIAAAEGSIIAGHINFGVASGFTTGNVAAWRFEGTNSGTYIWFSAEL